MTRGPATLYRCTVFHARLRPFHHQFRYRVFSLLVDIDRLAELPRISRLLGHDRRAVLSIWNRDHGPRDGTALRPWAEARLAEAGLDRHPGRIALLCFPRLWGYVFNPLSVYYCWTAAGRLYAVIHEVRNTFGEQHAYVLPALADDHGTILQSAEKCFHVSPFIGMAGHYRFRLAEPGRRLRLQIDEDDGDGPLLTASLSGTAQPAATASLALAVLRHPLMTLKVVAAIHWQALRLWLKGAPLHSKPEPASPAGPPRPPTGAER